MRRSQCTLSWRKCHCVTIKTSFNTLLVFVSEKLRNFVTFTSRISGHENIRQCKQKKFNRLYTLEIL